MGAVDEVKNLIRERDLDGLTQKLRTSGLDEQVSSWVANGRNLPVVGEQITRALGNDTVAGVEERRARIR